MRKSVFVFHANKPISNQNIQLIEIFFYADTTPPGSLKLFNTMGDNTVAPGIKGFPQVFEHNEWGYLCPTSLKMGEAGKFSICYETNDNPDILLIFISHTIIIGPIRTFKNFLK